MTSLDRAKATSRQDDDHLSLRIWWTYIRVSLYKHFTNNSAVFPWIYQSICCMSYDISFGSYLSIHTSNCTKLWKRLPMKCLLLSIFSKTSMLRFFNEEMELDDWECKYEAIWQHVITKFCPLPCHCCVCWSFRNDNIYSNSCFFIRISFWNQWTIAWLLLYRCISV